MSFLRRHTKLDVPCGRRLRHRHHRRRQAPQGWASAATVSRPESLGIDRKRRRSYVSHEEGSSLSVFDMDVKHHYPRGADRVRPEGGFRGEMALRYLRPRSATSSMAGHADSARCPGRSVGQPAQGVRRDPRRQGAVGLAAEAGGRGVTSSTRKNRREQARVSAAGCARPGDPVNGASPGTARPLTYLGHAAMSRWSTSPPAGPGYLLGPASATGPAAFA